MSHEIRTPINAVPGMNEMILREIARRAGMSESEQKDIYLGLLHDVGKIGIPDAVINKPGKLNDEEFGMIKRHPVMGYEILKDITELPWIGQGARWHHERYGGKTADGSPRRAWRISRSK